MNTQRQTGFTLSGMMFFLLLIIFVLYTATRIVPAYTDNWMVSSQLKTLVADPDLQNRSDESIRDQFAKQLSLNNITRITRSDLLIERIPGGIRLSVVFSSKQPFLGPVSLCLDFQPQAQAGSSGSSN